MNRTGNTEHCIQKLLHLLDKTAQAVPMEQKDVVHLLSQHDMIVFTYPVQFSNIPAMVRDFIKSNRNLWKNKKALCVANVGLFSGDGAGCLVLHPASNQNFSAEYFVRLLKRSPEKNREIIRAADRKIEQCRYDKYVKRR